MAVRDPYDIAYLPGVPTYLATYSYSPVAIEAAARVIVGEVGPTGTLPVDVPVAGRPEHGALPLRLAGSPGDRPPVPLEEPAMSAINRRQVLGATGLGLAALPLGAGVARATTAARLPPRPRRDEGRPRR